MLRHGRQFILAAFAATVTSLRPRLSTASIMRGIEARDPAHDDRRYRRPALARWLTREPPNLKEVRACLELIANNGDRANQVGCLISWAIEAAICPIVFN